MRLAATPRAQRLSRSAVSCIFYAALLGLAIAWGALRGHADVFVLAGRTPHPLLGAAFGLVIGLAAAFVTRLLTHTSEWARRLHHELHSLVHGIGSREIFLLALSSAVAEEAFFRGVLQSVIGVWGQAVLFAAVHFRPNRRFYAWTAMSLVVGVAFGLIAQYTGDLSAPIVAHFTINFVNLGYISRTEMRA